MATKTNYLELSKAEETDEILQTLRENNENFDIIDTEFEELNTEVEELNTSVEGLGSQTSQLELQLSSIGGNVNTLNTTVSQMGGNVNTLNNTVSQIQGSVNTLNNTVSQTESSVNTLNTTVSQIQGSVNTLNTTVGEIGTQVDELEDIVSELEQGGTGGTGLIELEASSQNIVDFNTLVGEGIYLVKNATTSTTTNGPSLGSAGIVVIEVGSKDNVIFQSIMTITNNGIPYHRQRSGGTWSSWLSTIATGVIRAGTLNAGMACNTPTADTHLTNKAYVDSLVATLSQQIPNITAQTTDLTAGVSSLATGSIVLVYE